MSLFAKHWGNYLLKDHAEKQLPKVFGGIG
jgi:hypothetical protein